MAPIRSISSYYNCKGSIFGCVLAPKGASRKLNVGVPVWRVIRCKREDNRERTSCLFLARETSSPLQIWKYEEKLLPLLSQKVYFYETVDPFLDSSELWKHLG